MGEERRGTGFRQELERLINKHNRENASNTPDFILADYIVGCLKAFDAAVRDRDRWYDDAPKPRPRQNSSA